MPGKNPTYKVKVNEFEFSFSKEEIEAADIINKSPVEFSVLKDHRPVQAKLITADMTNKKLAIEIKGEIFGVLIKDELDQELEKMGLSTTSGKQLKDIKAPMPGLVLEIAVTEGQEVAAGDKILILQAMKMENSIMIHASARIKRVAVATGQAVEKGQVLVELE